MRGYEKCLTKSQKLEKTKRFRRGGKNTQNCTKRLLMTWITKTVLSLSKSQTSWSVTLNGL